MCLIIFTYAFMQQNLTINLIGLAVHWVLDMADGRLARAFKQETVFGAQFDILSDRLLVIFFLLNLILLKPVILFPVVLYFAEFILLDTFLSIQFLNWGIISPNYFYKVDHKIWVLNWSPPAKFLNSSLVILLLLLTDLDWLPAFAAVLLIIIKLFSIIRLQKIIQTRIHRSNDI